jgi:hypothetical protein
MEVNMMYTEEQVKELMSKMFDHGVIEGRKVERSLIYDEVCDMLNRSFKYDTINGSRFRGDMVVFLKTLNRK